MHWNSFKQDFQVHNLKFLIIYNSIVSLSENLLIELRSLNIEFTYITDILNDLFCVLIKSNAIEDYFTKR